MGGGPTGRGARVDHPRPSRGTTPRRLPRRTPAADRSARRPEERTTIVRRPLDRFVGLIAAAGFTSGEQVVVGLWRRSPLGPMVDVMWVRPDGTRVLLAPREEVRRYVAGLYRFDEHRVVPFRGGWTGARVELTAGPLALDLTPAARDWRSWLFAARPRVLRRSPAWLSLEDRLVAPLGGLLLGGAPGVRLAGPTPGGRREWYGIDDYRRLASGRCTVDGADAGALAPLRRGLGVGLSDFPTVPALVDLVTLVEPEQPGGRPGAAGG